MKFKIALTVMVALLISTLAFAGDNRPNSRKEIQTSVTVTDVSTEIISENLSGHDLFIQNNDAAGIVYLNFTTTATVSDTMIKLYPGDKLTAVNIKNAVNAIGSIPSNANVAVLIGR